MQSAIAPLIHQIQNHLQIIMLEIELLIGDKNAKSKRVVYALQRMNRSIHELQSISRRLTPPLHVKSTKRHARQTSRQRHRIAAAATVS
jgi:hypothetical protein